MADTKGYMTLPEQKGSVNIAEDVIAAIAVGAVREVEGVSGMMSGNSVTDLANSARNDRKSVKGVKIDMSGDALVLDVYVAVAYGHPIPEVAEKVQAAVAGSVEAMTGCPVAAVDVHVGGVTLA